MIQYKQTVDGYTLDGLYIPDDSSNRHYIDMQKKVSDSEAEIIPYMAPDLTDHEKKLAGIEFQGVMCSATESDQNGLLSMRTPIKEGLFEPNFKFENGNRLVLTKDNIDALLTVWAPFRNGFFQ